MYFIDSTGKILASEKCLSLPLNYRSKKKDKTLYLLHILNHHITVSVSTNQTRKTDFKDLIIDVSPLYLTTASIVLY